MSAVKMWHPKGDCQIGLTSGHTFVVPGEKAGVEVPPKFRKEAIARGCILVGMEAEEEEAPNTFDRGASIRAKMRDMMTSDDPTYFTGDGRPALPVLNRLLGFTIDRTERDREWKVVEQDPDGTKADDE